MERLDKRFTSYRSYRGNESMGGKSVVKEQMVVK